MNKLDFYHNQEIVKASLKEIKTLFRNRIATEQTPARPNTHAPSATATPFQKVVDELHTQYQSDPNTRNKSINETKQLYENYMTLLNYTKTQLRDLQLLKTELDLAKKFDAEVNTEVNKFKHTRQLWTELRNKAEDLYHDYKVPSLERFYRADVSHYEYTFSQLEQGLASLQNYWDKMFHQLEDQTKDIYSLTDPGGIQPHDLQGFKEKMQSQKTRIL